MKKFLKLTLFVAAAAIGLGIFFLNSALIIGSGYSSKYLCSQVFLANRDPDVVFKNDVLPTHPLFRFITNTVDKNNKTVTANAFGFLSRATAVYREGCGCTLAVDTPLEVLYEQAKNLTVEPERGSDGIWPNGEVVDGSSIPRNVDQDKLKDVIEKAFREPGENTLRNTHAVVVVYRDKIIAEKYEAQFTEKTPMLGWSMTKSVTNALMGILVRESKLDIMQPAPVEAWQAPGDERNAITLDHMLRMSSGLEFEEIYAPFKDATQMLYKSKSMADYAVAKPLKTKPDEKWYYSSGTTNILARIIRDTVGGSLPAVINFAQTELFHRINVTSAVIEADASGSLVGSSYMFATARDWARFGVFIKNDGTWNGIRILPEGWVQYSLTPTPKAPKGKYGAQFWLNAGSKGSPKDRMFPSLPKDMAYLGGFNFQIVAIIPSRDVVIVRLGATHDDSWSHESFIGNVLACIEE